MADYYADRERDWERGRRYRGQAGYGGHYGYPPERERDWERRGDERGFFDRAGDEVRSWFGDEEASRRRMRDERESGGRSWADRDWWPGRDRERSWGERSWGDERRWRGNEDVDRDWARQWGYVEGRGGGERMGGRGGGFMGGYGAGSLGGRTEWSGSGGYEPGGYGFGGWQGGWWPERGAQGRTGYEAERRSMRGGMSGGRFAGRGPRGYQRSDERIREDVCDRMSEHPDLDAGDIEVRVSNAEVTLLGTVRDRQDKRLAEDLVDEVSGVREIHNQIRVQRENSQEQQNRPGGEPRYRVA